MSKRTMGIHEVAAISTELEYAIGETIDRVIPEEVEEGVNYFKLDVLFTDGFNFGIKVNIEDFEKLSREDAIRRLADSIKNGHLEAKIGTLCPGGKRGSVDDAKKSISSNYVTDTFKKAFDPESIGVDTIIATEPEGNEDGMVMVISFEDGTTLVYLVRYDLFRDKGIVGAAQYIKAEVMKMHTEALAKDARQEKARWN